MKLAIFLLFFVDDGFEGGIKFDSLTDESVIFNRKLPYFLVSLPSSKHSVLILSFCRFKVGIPFAD